MAITRHERISAENRFGGSGTIHIEKLLGPAELDGKCAMYARVTIPPHASMGLHRHEGNTETYHILSGRARYNDNGTEVEIGPGTTTFCGDGEAHAIENISDNEDLVFMALVINK
ncbi:MAG: cupin domain-containing protein [Selenomonas artemidis]|uniref:cupin domain-containing protein n=1 Tax=Selenomonas sp. F0473 TaxID=999423 RepID=UPI00029DEB15|nr:cupin domain-containing protein [Selenomonas sp. F0473]EKU70627.1 hypothetical protein HMPREF9161_01673 [Selenomonas sp. F0473]